MVALGEPLLLQQLFDSLLDRSRHARAVLAFAGLGGLMPFSELLNAGLDWLTWRVRLALDFALMRAGIERLHQLPLA